MGSMRTEKEKMVAGEYYLANDAQLCQDRAHARALMHTFNAVLDYSDTEGKAQLLQELLGATSVGKPPFFEPPFRCDYG